MRDGKKPSNADFSSSLWDGRWLKHEDVSGTIYVLCHGN